MIKKVALIYPPYSQGVPTPGTISAPMGLLSVATKLHNEGFDVSVIDANVEGLSFEAIHKRVRKIGPEIIGISCVFSAFYNSVKALSKTLKDNLNIPIVVGGNQATAMSDYIIKEEGIDVIIRGEGELVFTNLLKNNDRDLKNLREVKGITFKSNGQIIKNAAEETLFDLNSNSIQSYNLFPMDRYKEYDMAFSRGCPFRCTYCASSVVFGRKVRFRKIDNVIDELDYLIKNFGRKLLVFYDDTFTIKEDYVEEFLQKMMDKNWNINWRCATRVNVISRHILEKMKKAGCILIKFGVESGNQRILKIIKKDTSQDKIKKAIELTKEVGMAHSAFYMIGNRTEDRESIFDSFRLIKETKPEMVSFAITVPLPGTELADSLIKDSLIDLSKIDWDIMLPLRLISRDYERYSAELASRWCALSPDEIIEYAQMGKIMADLNYIFNISEFLRYARETNIFEALRRYLKIVLNGLTKPKLFSKSIKTYFSL